MDTKQRYRQLEWEAARLHRCETLRRAGQLVKKAEWVSLALEEQMADLQAKYGTFQRKP